MDEDDFLGNALCRMSERRRSRFQEGFNWAAVVSPALAALTAWWAISGDRLMLPVSTFFVVLTCVLWGWKTLRPANARLTNPDGGRATSLGLAGKLFIYAWILVVLAGYFGFRQGFSPSGLSYAAMVVFASIWAVVLLGVVRAPTATMRHLSLRQSVFVLAISLPAGAGTGYDLGWLYTVRYGEQTSSVQQVVSKNIRYGRGGADYFVGLACDGPLSPSHPIAKSMWQHLVVGSNIQMAETRSPLGTWVRVAPR